MNPDSAIIYHACYLFIFLFLVYVFFKLQSNLWEKKVVSEERDFSKRIHALERVTAHLYRPKFSHLKTEKLDIIFKDFFQISSSGAMRFS